MAMCVVSVWWRLLLMRSGFVPELRDTVGLVATLQYQKNNLLLDFFQVNGIRGSFTTLQAGMRRSGVGIFLQCLGRSSDAAARARRS
jgi:hypothetical protein